MKIAKKILKVVNTDLPQVFTLIIGFFKVLKRNIFKKKVNIGTVLRFTLLFYFLIYKTKKRKAHKTYTRFHSV